MVVQIISWIAIVILSVSYWFQIWKIHVHKEVRDISLTYNILLAVGFGILAYTAYQENSAIFLVKQVMTTVPVVIIIFQVMYHRNDKWHDPELKKCATCNGEIEHPWKFCPYCGNNKSDQL